MRVMLTKRWTNALGCLIAVTAMAASAGCAGGGTHAQERATSTPGQATPASAAPTVQLSDMHLSVGFAKIFLTQLGVFEGSNCTDPQACRITLHDLAGDLRLFARTAERQSKGDPRYLPLLSECNALYDNWGTRPVPADEFTSKVWPALQKIRTDMEAYGFPQADSSFVDEQLSADPTST